MSAQDGKKDKKKTDFDDGLTQSERFIKAAQELGIDDDPERFKAIVKKIGSAKPKPSEAAKSSGSDR